MTSSAAKGVAFSSFRDRAAQRTVIDQRLTWKQRDDVAAVLADLARELSGLRRTVHATAITDMAPLVVTCRDVDRVAQWLDSMGKTNAANDTRTALYAAALRLRQIVEV